MIEQILTDANNSITEKETLVIQLGEQAKANLYANERYGAFPETNSERPLDDTPVVPDNLSGKFDNEAYSLADLGVTPEEFNVVNGVGHQLKFPDGKVGFYILYTKELTIADTDDIDFVGFGEIGDVVTAVKRVDYKPTVKYGDWALSPKVLEDDLLEGVM